MKVYIDVIAQAFILFPFIALIISVPFVLGQYHRYGSISLLKALLLYSFVLYLLCAYFLVVLPFPSRAEVAAMTTPRAQLIPFRFIYEFIQETPFDIHDLRTIKAIFMHRSFYLPAYNLLLTMPFGIYIHYYFHCSAKKVILYTFLLSLFFELTQLSGLYFIYPRSYRMFDIDDLIINTAGGLLGYLLFGGIAEYLPKQEELNRSAVSRSRAVTGFRRTTAFITDFAIVALLAAALYLITRRLEGNTVVVLVLMVFVYYFIIPCFRKGSTIGQWIVRIRVVTTRGSFQWKRLFARRLTFAVLYLVIPAGLLYAGVQVYHMDISTFRKITLLVLDIGAVGMLYIVTAVLHLFSNQTLLYEKLSGTRLASTLKLDANETGPAGNLQTDENGTTGGKHAI